MGTNRLLKLSGLCIPHTDLSQPIARSQQARIGTETDIMDGKVENRDRHERGCGGIRALVRGVNNDDRKLRRGWRPEDWEPRHKKTREIHEYEIGCFHFALSQDATWF